VNLEEFIILERRISKIKNKMEFIFNFDVITTKHVEDRQYFYDRGLDVDTYGYISNKEIIEFISFFKNEISEQIAYGNIKNQTNFVIRSLPRQLSMAIVANNISGTSWQLIIKTVFRETDEFKLRVGVDQLVLEK